MGMGAGTHKDRIRGQQRKNSFIKWRQRHVLLQEKWLRKKTPPVLCLTWKKNFHTDKAERKARFIWTRNFLLEWSERKEGYKRGRLPELWGSESFKHTFFGKTKQNKAKPRTTANSKLESGDKTHQKSGIVTLPVQSSLFMVRQKTIRRVELPLPRYSHKTGSSQGVGQALRYC